MSAPLFLEAMMKRTLAAVVRFVRAEHGQDLVEYGMLMTLIAVAAILVVTQVGTTINNVFWQFIASNVAANL
jgi:Flp pilus assembly pilin Flp